MDWNDLRYFLGVARGGSTLAASKALKVSQTTVARRVAALEAALGLNLFERRQAGYVLTEAGAHLLPHAQAVEAAAVQATDVAAGAARKIGGHVRITTAAIYAVTVLPPLLAELRRAHPEIVVELDTSDGLVDLAAGAADIAFRSTAHVENTGAGLFGRRIGPDPWTIYCSRDYAQQNDMSALSGHPFIGGGGESVWPHYRRWLQKLGLLDAIVMHQSSATGLLASVKAGHGLAVLPTFLADRDPELVRCVPPPRHETVTLWLLSHERLRNTPRVRAVVTFLGERLSAMAAADPLSEARPPILSA